MPFVHILPCLCWWRDCMTEWHRRGGRELRPMKLLRWLTYCFEEIRRLLRSSPGKKVFGKYTNLKHIWPQNQSDPYRSINYCSKMVLKAYLIIDLSLILSVTLWDFATRTRDWSWRDYSGPVFVAIVSATVKLKKGHLKKINFK